MHLLRGAREIKEIRNRTIVVMTDSEITYAIRGAIYDVYMVLGPGLLESAYEMALAYHLR